MPNVLYLLPRSNYQNTIKFPCMQVLYSSECHRLPLAHHSQDLNTEIILIWQRMNEKAWRAFPSLMPIIVAEKCIKPRLKYSNHLSVIQYILNPNFYFFKIFNYIQAKEIFNPEMLVNGVTAVKYRPLSEAFIRILEICIHFS